MVVTIPLFYTPENAGLDGFFDHLRKFELIHHPEAAADDKLVQVIRNGNCVGVRSLPGKFSNSFVGVYFTNGKADLEVNRKPVKICDWRNLTVMIAGLIMHEIIDDTATRLAVGKDFVQFEILDY